MFTKMLSGVSLFMTIITLTAANISAKPQITLQQIKNNDFNGKFCYVHARGAITPDGKAIITTQPLYLKGIDDFFGLEIIQSNDKGETWSKIRKSKTLVRRKYKNNCDIVMSDGTPFYHRKTGKLIITGHSVIYGKLSVPNPRYTLWSIFDEKSGDWQPFQKLTMPDEKTFFNCGAGSTQILELPDGDLLIPVYGASAEDLKKTSCYNAWVLKCSFNGKELKVKEVGSPLKISVPRGLGEPSIAQHNGKFFLALRNDKSGYVSFSNDGLNFQPAQELCFDDGSNIGNYCTQQHWINGGGKLYMVYTRKNANNDHIFRHRAPLFIAEFDTEKMCLIRSTEMIAVPERGARLGNFGCMQINENESWIIAAEWMQTTGPDTFDYTKCMKYGSDNSIWIAKIKFNK